MGQNISTLIADIGGTNIRFALAVEREMIGAVWQRPCADFADLYAAVQAYLNDLSPSQRPTRAAFAVACPVQGDNITLTNLAWSFSTEEVRTQFGFTSLELVNDFAAIAYAIPHLQSGDLRQVGGGNVCAGLPIGVLGPGTGLGVTALVEKPSGTVVFETEGGHVTLPASNDFEAKVIAALRQRFGHVSAERVLSGPGLVNLYQVLADLEGIHATDGEPQNITATALSDPNSLEARVVQIFSTFLGTVAADLALSLGARGGIYIAGGIVKILGPAFDVSSFRPQFENKGRFAQYLSDIPTFVITHPNPALLGLAKHCG